MLVGMAAAAQTVRITGTVTDAIGPVVGASIIESGTQNGAITDLEGHFTLNVQPGASIEISSIGYVTQVIAVGNQTQFAVMLEEDRELLDEVVVVGYICVKIRCPCRISVLPDDLLYLLNDFLVHSKPPPSVSPNIVK